MESTIITNYLLDKTKKSVPIKTSYRKVVQSGLLKQLKEIRRIVTKCSFLRDAPDLSDVTLVCKEGQNITSSNNLF